MPAKDDVIQSLYVEIVSDTRKLDKGFESSKKKSKKTAEDIEKVFKRHKIDMDNRVAKMKLKELQAIHKALEQQWRKKMELGADSNSIRKTEISLKSVEDRIRQLRTEGEKTGDRLKQDFEKRQTTLQRLKSAQ